MKVRICVGSSCHLKGAPQVIAAFQDILAQRPELAAEVELEACYCQDRCQEGVTCHRGTIRSTAGLLRKWWSRF